MVKNKLEIPPLTLKEFSELQGESTRNIWRKIKQKIYIPICAKDKCGYGGGKSIRLPYTHLSNEKQRIFLQSRGLIDLEIQDGDFSEYGSKGAQKATQRKEIIDEYHELLKSKAGRRKNEVKRNICNKHSISMSSLCRWLKNYGKMGFKGLFDNWKGGAKSTITKEMSEFLFSLYMTPQRRSRVVVYEQFCREFEDKVPKLPNPRTVSRFIDLTWTKEEQLYYRNPREWEKNYAPYVRRDYSDLEVYELLCGDHRQHDTAVFADESRKKIIFPWLTAWMDVRSRRFVGWHVCERPNARTIALAFYYAARKFGIPREVYIDNGKDFKSRYLDGTERKVGRIDFDSETNGLFASLDIKVRHALPFNAKAKPIESNFRFLPFRYERELPGWRGSNVKDRPEKLKKEIKEGKLLTLDEFRKRVDAFIEEHNRHPHKALGGKTPVSFFENNFTKRGVREETLQYLLMPEIERTIRNSQVEIDNISYINKELLWKLNGQKVILKRDPHDCSFAFVEHQGKFFCIARAAIPSGWGENISEKALQDRKKIESNIRKHRKGLEANYRKRDDKTYLEKDSVNTPPVEKENFNNKVIQLTPRDKAAREAMKTKKKLAEEGMLTPEIKTDEASLAIFNDDEIEEIYQRCNEASEYTGEGDY